MTGSGVSGASGDEVPTTVERDGHPGARERYDWDRLERAVRALVARQESLRGECDALRNALEGRDDRIRRLEAQLLEANQLRQDTGKRLDELIGQLDQLDEQLASLETGG